MAVSGDLPRARAAPPQEVVAGVPGSAAADAHEAVAGVAFVLGVGAAAVAVGFAWDETEVAGETCVGSAVEGAAGLRVEEARLSVSELAGELVVEVPGEGSWEAAMNVVGGPPCKVASGVCGLAAEGRHIAAPVEAWREGR